MFYEQTDRGYILRIRVSPNASKCGICGLSTDEKGAEYLKISVVSVPEKGKANRELIKFLSKALHLSKSSISVIRGETDRNKVLRIDTTPTAETEALLTAWEKQENDGTTIKR